MWIVYEMIENVPIPIGWFRFDFEAERALVLSKISGFRREEKDGV